ncbi:MAG: alpha/beta hydrolase [Acidobacteria bacterium]|nr:alpha/beta hydrolase [Acidobacteriota bacterium]
MNTDPESQEYSPWPSCDCSLDLEAGNTHYVEAGTGFPVVLIHGLLGYSFCWRKNITELAKHFHVFALDLAGCGYSGEIRQGSYGVAAWSEQVRQFLDAMKIEKAHLVGTSAGGAVAVDFASGYPERVGRIVLVAPVNPFSRRVASLARIYRSFGPPLLLVRWLMRAIPHLLPWFFRHRYYADFSRLTPETIPGYRQGLRGEISAQMLRHSIRNWQAASMETQLASIANPTLLVWGDQDKLVPPDCASSLSSALSNARAVTISGAGHFCYEELPEEFNREVIQFLLGERDSAPRGLCSAC